MVLVLRVLDQFYEDCGADTENRKTQLQYFCVCKHRNEQFSSAFQPQASFLNWTLTSADCNKPTRPLKTSPDAPYHHKLHLNSEEMVSVACESQRGSHDAKVWLGSPHCRLVSNCRGTTVSRHEAGNEVLGFHKDADQNHDASTSCYSDHTHSFPFTTF
jgi:hypothetical protein